MPVSKNPLVNYLVYSALIGMIAAVGWLSYASVRSADIQETNLMAYSEKYGIVFNVDRTLYRTDAEGHFIEKIGVLDLGLSDAVGDIVFAGNTLLAAEGDTHRIVRCSVPFWQCAPIATVERLPKLEALDIAVTPDGKHFYVSCSNAHRLLYYGIDGTFKYRLKVDEKLSYPNDMMALGNGKIVVTDTYNHRIALIEDNRSAATVVGEVGVARGPGYYTWPTSLTQTSDGRMWVLVQNMAYSKGEVVVFESLPKAGAVYIEGSDVAGMYGVNPVAPLLAVGEEVLVSDIEHFDLLRLSAFSGKLEPFGDALVREALRAAGEARDFWETQVLLSQIGIMLFVLMLMAGVGLEYASTPDKQSLVTRPKKYEEALSGGFEKTLRADTGGIVWLAPKEKIVKKLKLLGLLILVLMVMLWGTLLTVVLNSEHASDLGMLWLPVSVMSLIMMVLAVVVGVAFGRQRIGVKGRRIYMVDVFGRRADEEVENVIYTERRVVIDNIAVPLYDGQGNTIYEEKEFAGYLLPLLEDAVKGSELELFIAKLKNGDRNTWILLIVSLAMTIGILWYWSVEL